MLNEDVWKMLDIWVLPIIDCDSPHYEGWTSLISSTNQGFESDQMMEDDREKW
jgi:hypothetical protein